MTVASRGANRACVSPPHTLVSAGCDFDAGDRPLRESALPSSTIPSCDDIGGFCRAMETYSHYWVECCMPNTPDEPPVVHIVDDDADLGDGLSSVLRSVGLNAKAYRSTQDFLGADDLDALGCIVLDIRLPGTNGLDFQEKLVGLGIRLPVILMTGHGDIPMSVRAMKAGAVDFLPKPFRDQDMIDAVTAAID